jgi:hypothetical protein
MILSKGDIFDDQTKCDGCKNLFYTKSLQTSNNNEHNIYACDSCLEDNIMNRCESCCKIVKNLGCHLEQSPCCKKLIVDDDSISEDTGFTG